MNILKNVSCLPNAIWLTAPVTQMILNSSSKTDIRNY